MAWAKVTGLIRVSDRSMALIDLIEQRSQYRSLYFMDYLVRSPNLELIKVKRVGLKSAECCDFASSQSGLIDLPELASS